MRQTPPVPASGLFSRPHRVTVQPAREEKVNNTKQVVTLGSPVIVQGQLTPAKAGDYFDAQTGAALAAPFLFLCNLSDAEHFAYGYRVTDGRGRQFAVCALPEIWDAGQSTDGVAVTLDNLTFG